MAREKAIRFLGCDWIYANPVTNPYAPGAGTQPPELAAFGAVRSRACKSTIAVVSGSRGGREVAEVGRGRDWWAQLDSN